MPHGSDFSPIQGVHPNPQISDILKGASMPTKSNTGHQAGSVLALQSQEMKRRRRRESHNLVERRRRDNINERIQELSHLVPMHRLEDEKVRKALQNNSPLSPNLAAPDLPYHNDSLLDNSPTSSEKIRQQRNGYSAMLDADVPRNICSRPSLQYQAAFDVRSISPTQQYETSPGTVSYPRSSTETYNSSIDSQEELYKESDSYDPDYEVPEYQKVVERELEPSNHSEFANYFPSTRRFFIRHDDITYDGNMNLRVDTEGRKKESIQLFHMRMHDLKKREFSLQRYTRSLDREDSQPIKSHKPLSDILGRTYSKVTQFKRKAVEVLVNGVSYFARPDSGSDRNIISEECAKDCRVSIMRGKNDKSFFKLGIGKYISSIGRAYVPLSLLGDAQSKEYCWFDVLAKCSMPLIIGLEFVQKIQLYTKNKHLLVESPFNFSMPTLKWIGTPKGRIEFIADGKTLMGGADTGSDLDFMSLGCARRRGFKIDRRESARTRVMLPDQTIVETIGQVHISSLQVSDFESFEMTFHVLPGLSCDVIFGEEFLEQMDAFNTCDILDGEEDPSIYSLHTLINLGPIQSFLARKCLAKTLTPEEDSLLLEHDAGIEAEIYRRNKANRAISKIKNRARVEAAREEEEVKRRRFDRGHENCVHCSVGEDPGSESSST